MLEHLLLRRRERDGARLDVALNATEVFLDAFLGANKGEPALCAAVAGGVFPPVEHEHASKPLHHIARLRYPDLLPVGHHSFNP